MLVYVLLLLQTALGPIGHWTYTSTYDRMRESRTQIAGLEALNQAKLGTPYRGITRATLAVTKRGDLSLVQVLIENGVLSCGQCSVLVKLDSQPATYWSASSNESNSDLVIDAPWDGSQRRFNAVEEIGKAHEIQIEVPFYGKGSFQYRFVTSSDLSWPSK
jgi:hypothetical protein